MLAGRTLVENLKLMGRFSPAFLTSLIFKVGSIAIVCTFLKEYSAIYLGVGAVLAFIVAAYFYHDHDDGYIDDECIGSGIFYALTNVTIVSKCPLGSRKQNFPQMKAVSLVWLVMHTVTLIILMVFITAMDPSTHLDHWSDHRFRFKDNQALFFATTCAVIASGPISILFLWRLKKQVKAVEEKDGKVELFWRGVPW